MASFLYLAFSYRKWIAVAFAILAVFSFYKWQVSKAYRQGQADAVAKIERANKAANEAADKGEAAALACHRKPGFRWNRETGKCVRI